MTAERDYLDYVDDMLRACEKAKAFTAGMDFQAFEADDRTVFAVIRALEVIGEAARRIPEDFRALHPEVPWRAMAGIRDKLIHDYSGVNVAVVWKTVQDDLPLLQSLLQDINNPQE